MAFIGRIFGSIASAYREMNQATLTGAIDVIVVRQPDGSLRASPFHVRFGKVGVFRSREKVVDITLNGEPVDLKMKLGDAGEAFFVELKDDESLVAPYLCTSPLPGEDAEAVMQKGIAEMKMECEARERKASQSHEPTTTKTPPLAEASTTTSDESGKENEVHVTRDAGAVAFRPTALQDLQDADVSDESSFGAAVAQTPKTRQFRRKRKKSTSKRSPGSTCAATPQGNDATPTPSVDPYSDDIFAMEIERVDERVEEWSSDEAEPSVGDALPSALTPLGAGRKSVATATTPSLDIGAAQPLARKISRSLPHDVETLSRSTSRTLENDIRGRVMIGRGGSGVTNVTEPLVAAGTELFRPNSTDGVAFSFGEEVAELHPFSDGDLSPPMGSPIRRPFSPQSDSELLDRPSFLSAKDRRFSNVNWSWGQLPRVKSEEDKLHKVSEEAEATTPTVIANSSSPEAAFSSATVFSTPAASPVETAPSEPALPAGGAEEAPLRKTPPDMTLEELDRMRPEVKALYLTRPSRNASMERRSFPESSIQAKEEDVESATGSSLPQSPQPNGFGCGATSSGFESDNEGQPIGNRSQGTSTSCCHQHQILDDRGITITTREPTSNCDCASSPASKVSFHLGATPESSRQNIATETLFHHQHPDIQLSLCGALKSGSTVSNECFMLSLVTFDEFCENPDGILANPDLVLKVDDRYYNWVVAAPILLTLGAYGRPLPSMAVNSLLKKHQPQVDNTPIGESNRKKSSGVASWFYWGSRSYDEVAEEENVGAVTPPLPSRIETCPASLSRADDSVADAKRGSMSDDETEASGVEQREYVKTIRLTPEQLAKLPLRDGVNDVIFSVTTSYQGTTRAEASIFLWNWDDKLIVSDIDGTITRSDVLGQVLPLVGKDWSQDGITALYRRIVDNGYRVIYLSARAIGQAGITRSYLQSIRQESHFLPNGPLLLSPSSLIHAFHREVIEKKPEEFKIGCLKDIAKLFPWRQMETPTLEADIAHVTMSGSEGEENLSEANTPFFAGFGNKNNDVVAYRAVGVPLARIFTVNHKGEICHELMKNYRTTYSSLREMADHAFPFIYKGDILTSPRFPAPSTTTKIDSRRSSPAVARSVSVDVSAAFVASGSATVVVTDRRRASTSNAPKCYFFEGEQYSSFAYWREPVPCLDEEMGELLEATG